MSLYRLSLSRTVITITRGLTVPSKYHWVWYHLPNGLWKLTKKIMETKKQSTKRRKWHYQDLTSSRSEDITVAERLKDWGHLSVDWHKQTTKGAYMEVRPKEICHENNFLFLKKVSYLNYWQFDLHERKITVVKIRMGLNRWKKAWLTGSNNLAIPL